jgi:hypothetical protein
MSPADLASRLSGKCMDAGFSVMAADDRQVYCAKEVSGFKGILTQLLIGNAYSTTPTDNVRFQLVPWNGGTRAQVSEWIETQMAFGQVQRVPLNNGKQTNAWLSAFYRLGGTEVPPLQIVSTSVPPVPASPPAEATAVAAIAAPAPAAVIPAPAPAPKPITQPRTVATERPKAKRPAVTCITCEE